MEEDYFDCKDLQSLQQTLSHLWKNSSGEINNKQNIYTFLSLRIINQNANVSTTVAWGGFYYSKLHVANE